MKASKRNLAIVSGTVLIIITISLTGFLVNNGTRYSSQEHTINEQQYTITTQKWLIDDLNAQIANQSLQLAKNNNTILSLTNQVANFTSQVNSLNSQATNSKSQTSTDASTIANLQSQLSTANSQISVLNSQVTTLQAQVNNLTATINSSKPKLQTLVFHVCEKGESYDWGHLPDANATYNQILALNNKYNILLLPEYQGNANFTEELGWITTKFGGKQGVPIMLDVFGGGDGPNPVPLLSLENISSVMAVSNVKYLRFAEVISWHEGPPELPFPVDYVNSVLQFCRANNLKLFWTEWKVEAFPTLKTYIAGYEDIVTVSFSTNSEYREPSDGFTQISQTFQHWGGSVQAWYWEKRHNSTLMNMPAPLLTEHAVFAKTLGAEIIEFEPYWYFFNNGVANDNLRLLEAMLA
jgi:uncharacterized coiled-coil protein SlyX